MNRQKSKPVIHTIIKYSFFIAIILWFFYLQVIWIPLSSGSENNLSLSFLFFPLLSLAFSFLISDAIILVSSGKNVDSFSYLVKRLGVAISISLLIAYPPSPAILQSISIFALLVGLILVIALTLRKQYNGNEKWKLVIYSTSILFIGLVTSLALCVIPHLETQRLEIIVLSGSVLSAAFVLMGFLKRYPNTVLCRLGELLSSDVSKMYFSVMLVLLYVFYFRQVTLLALGENASILILTEWTIFCASTFIIYRRAVNHLPSSIKRADVKGYWGAHHQRIEYFTDNSLDNWSLLSERYVKTGDEKLLYNALSELLGKDKRLQESVDQALSSFIDHRDEKPGRFSLPWNFKEIEERNIRARRNVVRDVFLKVQDIMR
jgi:hypothetical protein